MSNQSNRVTTHFFVNKIKKFITTCSKKINFLYRKTNGYLVTLTEKCRKSLILKDFSVTKTWLTVGYVM